MTITRRGFLLGAGAGLAAGVAGGWSAARRFGNADFSSFAGRTREVSKPEFGMPGPFPGRVIEVHHRGSVGPDDAVNRDAVRAMVDRGLSELTGADHADEAWRRFFEKGDVVGIKVNPVGFRRRPGV